MRFIGRARRPPTPNTLAGVPAPTPPISENMKLTKTCLLVTLATPALLAFALPAQKVAFTPSSGQSLTRTFTTTHEMVLDDMSITVNGAPFSQMEMNMNMSMSSNVEVTDMFDSVEEGKVKKLTRTFETISSSGAVQVESAMMPENVDTTIDSASDLEGKTVVFAWDADGGEFLASFPDDEGDADLLEGLEQDMDLTVFLPGKEVAEGETWELDVQEIAKILMPGGNLKLTPDEGDMPEGLPGMEGMGGNIADMLGDIGGEASAEYKGTRDVDGVSCAIIQFKIAITSAADMTDKVADAMDQMPEGMSINMDHMDVEMTLEGEGTLLWNLSAGHAHSLELASSINSIMDMGMSMDAQGQKMDMEQVMEMSGTVDIAVKIGG